MTATSLYTTKMRTVQAVRISSDSVFEKLLLVSTFEKQREDYTEKNKQIQKNRPFGRFENIIVSGIDLYDKMCYNKEVK